MWHLFSCIFKKKKKMREVIFRHTYTQWKLSVFRVFLVRIFPYSDWIRRFIEHWWLLGKLPTAVASRFSSERSSVFKKRLPHTSVFLWILRNLLWKISANDSFWRKGEESERAYISIIFFIYVTDHLYIANHEYDDIR